MSVPAPQPARVLRFDAFELNLHSGELRKRGVRVRLHGQPVQILARLLASPGTLVTREELRAELWSAETFVDFDHSLHNAIARIRDVLGDSAEKPRFIETLPRRGYRFIAPVEEVHASPNVTAGSPETSNGITADRRRGLTLALSGCAIAFGVLVGWQLADAKTASSAVADVARAIAQQVTAQITADQARFRSTRAVDPQAYEAYLRGRYYLYNQSQMLQPLDAAKRYFEASIRKDPGIALTYAGLANVSLSMAFYRRASPEQAYRSTKQALAKALALENGLSEAHATLALLSWRYEWDWAAAEREFNYAIALDPNNDCVRADHANYLAWCGRRAEALAEVTKGRELNPGSSYNCTEASVYFQLGDYASLIEASSRGVVSDPTDWIVHYFLGVGYVGSGRRAEAVPEFEKAVAISDGDQDARAALAHAYGVMGRRSEADKILHELMQESKYGYVSPYMIAVIHAGLGDTDGAFEFLDNAVRERSLDLVWNLKTDPRLESLRSDPRFHTLWRRVGFPQ
jgi:DNA-binding winged helix-turn-helix (wHTH) protein/tetratricopeptide (TPR) repeat protein